jgi:hypothetical protein
MKIYIKIILTLFLVILFPEIIFAYQVHEPIIIRHPIEGNSASNPLVIEGYEISNPGGPCIFIEHIEHVVIRNNYLHNCGTDISARLIANNPRDDDCVGSMTNFMETGALNLFKVGSVKVYNNKLENNDYGIRIEGFDRVINGVEVFNNIIHGSHRSHFLWVKDARNVLIYGNDIRNNGLSEFFDNETLERIFAGEDLGCMDGRSQGIVVHSCDNVKIYRNFVLNSNSDGIGVADAPGDPYNSVNPSRNVEIYDNEIVENGEMGIWLAGAHNVSIFRNKIYQSKARINEVGGSSGIMLEINSVDIKIFDNKIYFNDRYGINITAGTNVNIYNNDISYNGNGGIELRYLDYVAKEGMNDIKISNNYIHNNRESAIAIKADNIRNILIEKNVFEKNGGGPINHNFYKDNDFSLHLEDWVLGEEKVLTIVPKEMIREVTMISNTGYVEKKDEVSSEEEIRASEEPTRSDNISAKVKDVVSKKDKKEKTTVISYVIGQVLESWTGSVIILIVFLIASLFIFKRKRKLGIILLSVIIVCLVSILVLKISNFDQKKQLNDKEQLIHWDEKDTISIKEHREAMKKFCEINLSDELIRKAQKSHFGVNHPGLDNYQDMVDAGLYWERFLISGTNNPKKTSKESIEELIRILDFRVMKAQSHGIQLVADIMFDSPVEDFEFFSSVLEKIVERYNHDGKEDMPCLKYPIKYYMIGNEVEVENFFNGTEEQYLEILITANKVIKKAYPDAKIVQAGMISAVNNPFWDKLLDMGAAEYFDVTNIHEVYSKDSIMKMYTFDEYVKERGIDNLEKWNTEIQFENTQKNPSLTSEEYARITAKYLIYALAHNYQKLFIVNFKSPVKTSKITNHFGQPPFGDPSAMVNSLNERTLVYDAVKTVISNLDNFSEFEIIFEEVVKGIDQEEPWNMISRAGAYKFTVNNEEIYVFWGNGKLSDYLKGTYRIQNIYNESSIKNTQDVRLTDSPIFVFSET